MHLLHKLACPFAWKVLIALQEAGLPHTEEVMDPPDRERLAGLSPQATTPVLVTDGGEGLWDSLAIAEYLADRAGGPLMPQEPEARARVRLLHTYSDRLIGPGLREVIFEKRSKPAAAWDRDRIQHGAMAWMECLDWLEQRVEAATGFVGGAFTLADCALVPRFALAERFGVGVAAARHPRLAAWYAEQARRPSVTTTRPERFGWVNPCNAVPPGRG